MTWITDRLPTKEDADQIDHVIIICITPTLDPNAYSYERWHLVTPGWPWRHTSTWTPPTPAPESTPAAPEPELQPEIPKLVRDGKNRLPQGLRTRRLALEERELEIRTAIKRYDDCEEPCPVEWLIELEDVKRQLETWKQNTPSRLTPAAPEPEPEKATRGFAWFNRVDVNPGHEVEEYAVATDGTAWWRIIGKDDRLEDKKWIQVHPLPQPGEE